MDPMGRYSFLVSKDNLMVRDLELIQLEYLAWKFLNNSFSWLTKTYPPSHFHFHLFPFRFRLGEEIGPGGID